MMVQAREEMGEGSANLTDPHHTPTIIEPSTSQLQKTKQYRKPRRKVTEVPQTSNPISVADEAIHEEMDDSLERAATTATSLIAKQDKAILESSKDKGLGEKDASKQGRIADINANEDITLVSIHDEQMFDADQDLGGEEVFVAQQDENVIEKEVDVAQVQVTTAATTPTISIDELEPWDDVQAKINADYQLTERLQAEEQQELNDEEKAKLFMQLLKKRRKFFTAKRVEEKMNKPPTQAQKRKIMCTYLKNIEGKKLTDLKNKSFDSIQKMFDKAFKMINTFVDYITELVEESSKKMKQKLQAKEQEELTDAEKVKLFMQFLKKRRKFFAAKRDEEKRDKPLTRAKTNEYHVKMLKIFDREDLEVLWRLVKARFEKVKPIDHMDSFLLHNLKTMFEHHVEDNVWKNQQGLVKVNNWKLYDSCRVYYVTIPNILYYLLVEKMYQLINHTLHQMFNDVKHQVDYECEMAFKLLRLVKKELKEGYAFK
nr:hypothetical protein [Tanacetum cinerariifolium]